MLSENFYFTFSGEAQNEIYDYIKELHAYEKVEQARLLMADECPT